MPVEMVFLRQQKLVSTKTVLLKHYEAVKGKFVAQKKIIRAKFAVQTCHLLKNLRNLQERSWPHQPFECYTISAIPPLTAIECLSP